MMYLFESHFFISQVSVNHVTETITVRSEIMGKCSWRVNNRILSVLDTLSVSVQGLSLVLKEQVH